MNAIDELGLRELTTKLIYRKINKGVLLFLG